MTDFLIVARVSAPDGLIEQSRLLAKVADALEPFGIALGEAVGHTVAVEIRRTKGSKRVREPKANGGREPRRTRSAPTRRMPHAGTPASELHPPPGVE
jgi:hypothetical protein